MKGVLLLSLALYTSSTAMTIHLVTDMVIFLVPFEFISIFKVGAMSHSKETQKYLFPTLDMFVKMFHTWIFLL